MIKTYEISAPRTIIGKALAEIQENNNNHNIIVIDNDLSTATNTADFNNIYPKHFWELGIGEQSSMSAACGLALEGFIPFYVNFAIFASGTIWTQIRQAAYANINVKIVATHPGLDAGLDGASHQATQDIALIRSIPNVTILTPSDIHEVKAALQYASTHLGVFYVRVSREPVPEIHTAEQHIKYELTNRELINMGDDLALIFDGSTLEIALEGMKLLKQEGIKAKLIHVRSIKPLDTKNLDELLKSVKCFITLENHSIIGGLGSAIAEYISDKKTKKHLGIVGIQDTFTSSGKSVELKKIYGVSANQILKYAKQFLN